MKTLLSDKSDFLAALEMAKVGFYDWNLDTDTVTVSDQFSAIWQVRSGSVLAEVLIRVHAEDRAQVERQIQTSIQEKTECRAEYRLVLPNGSITWVESRGAADYDAHGRAVRFFGTSIDITERKTIENELSVERKNLERLFDFSSAFVAATTGPSHIYSYVNPAHIRIVGANFAGRALREAVPQAKALAALFDRVFSTGVPESNFELPVEIEGSIHYMNANYVPTRDSSGAVSGVIAWGIDVTGEVQARRSAENAVTDLRAEREIRERFVEAITHDLRTPMTAMRMSAQMLERKSDDPQFVKMLSKRIVGNIDRSNRMIIDLLDANSIKAGAGVPVKFETCRIDEVIMDCALELVEVYGPRFEVIDRAGEVTGTCDPVALRRIIENLAGNACKYGTPKSIVQILFSKKETCVEIGVHNDGNPISPEDQLTIFAPYRRTDQAKSGGQVGWGIGLTLVKGLTDAHHGTIWVESTPESGTTFFVQLPITPANPLA